MFFLLVVDSESITRAPGVRQVTSGMLLESVPDATSPQYRPGLYFRHRVWSYASTSRIQRERFNLGELKCLLLLNCYGSCIIEAEFCWQRTGQIHQALGI